MTANETHAMKGLPPTVPTAPNPLLSKEGARGGG
jgi:hypothetical protein